MSLDAMLVATLFLAVFVAGLVVGSVRARCMAYQRQAQGNLDLTDELLSKAREALGAAEDAHVRAAAVDALVLGGMAQGYSATVERIVSGRWPADRSGA